MRSQQARRARQDLVCVGCFRGHGWRVGVCPRAGQPTIVSVTRSLVPFVVAPVGVVPDLVECPRCRFSGRAVCAGIGRRPFWGILEGVSCMLVPGGLVFVISQLCCFCWWLPRQISFARCSALEGLSARQVVMVTWDPQPRASIRESSPGGGRAQVSDLEQKGKTVGSACGRLTLWRSEVVVPVVRRCFSHGCSVSLVMTLGCSSPTSWRSGILGACVVRLWSHVVAPVFRELRCLGRCVPRVYFRVVLLWPDLGCGSWYCSNCFRMCLTLLVLRESTLA
ncbi:hypothetical protein Taro_024794 [Colocasia esculenta]|uniref:Uncharacterized protein n=1 Tax=Colocasia esculenta TaxID=4460 RepID=A0A843VII9_COLES|nr:hypothetical protein [Colocasia esculenta]